MGGGRIPKKYLGAIKAGHRKGVREYIDESFSHELYARAQRGDKEAEAALEWITKYNNEFYRGVLRKSDPDAIHNTPELYKEATNSHNARRRDLFCVVRSGAYGMGAKLVPISPFADSLDRSINKLRSLDHEETLIDLLSTETKHKVQKIAKLPLQIRTSQKGEATPHAGVAKKEQTTMSDTPTPTLPKDLEAQMQTIAAFAQTHAILHKASYPAQLLNAAMDCINFVKQAHEKSVEAALKHPKAELVPELKAVLDGQKEAKDGEG